MFLIFCGTLPLVEVVHLMNKMCYITDVRLIELLTFYEFIIVSLQRGALLRHLRSVVALIYY